MRWTHQKRVRSCRPLKSKVEALRGVFTICCTSYIVTLELRAPTRVGNAGRMLTASSILSSCETRAYSACHRDSASFKHALLVLLLPFRLLSVLILWKNIPTASTRCTRLPHQLSVPLQSHEAVKGYHLEVIEPVFRSRLLVAYLTLTNEGSACHHACVQAPTARSGPDPASPFQEAG